MRIYGDINSGNCLKVKYTGDYLGLDYEWIAVDITQGESRTLDFIWKAVKMCSNGYRIVNDFYHYNSLSVT